MRDYGGIFDALRERIRGTARLAVVGTGDDTAPEDHLGMYAAREIESRHISGVQVFFAGTVPESITGPLRRYNPGHTLFLDAADMKVRPGTIAVIEPEQIHARLLSTHVLPLSVVMEYIGQETGSGVTLIGIQPDLRGPGKDLTGEDLLYLSHNLTLLAEILRDRAG